VSGAPAGLRCPLCSEVAEIVIGTQQAICGNEECPALFWDPTKTIDELMSDIHHVTLWGPA
jgi:hypothetical protein